MKLLSYGLLLCVGVQSILFGGLKEEIIHDVHKVIETCDTYQDIRTDLISLLSKLDAEGHIVSKGSDAQNRPLFVGLQGIFEHVMSLKLHEGSLQDLQGAIHTPTPCTPLCMDAHVSSGLVKVEVEQDPKRLLTVQSRATILRQYLTHGGQLTIAYPKEGFFARSEEQRSVYASTCQYYKETLRDTPLDIEAFKSDMVGATYLFSDREGKNYLFAIKACQANAPSDDATWELWFGEENQPV